MPAKIRNLMLAMFSGLASVGVFADCPNPDTTKATVVDNLSVLGFNGSIATPEYLFDTVVTNEMYDVSGTNRNYWTKDPYVERYRIFVELNQDEHEHDAVLDVREEPQLFEHRRLLVENVAFAAVEPACRAYRRMYSRHLDVFAR